MAQWQTWGEILMDFEDNTWNFSHLKVMDLTESLQTSWGGPSPSPLQLGEPECPAPDTRSFDTARQQEHWDAAHNIKQGALYKGF